MKCNLRTVRRNSNHGVFYVTYDTSTERTLHFDFYIFHVLFILSSVLIKRVRC